MRSLVRISSLAAAVLAGVASFSLCVWAREAPYEPRLPALELRLADGVAEVVRGGHDDALNAQALKRELERLATHTDEDNGWKGMQEDGTSDNPVVLHVDALADYGEAEKVIAAAAEQMLYRMVVGVTQHLEKPLDGAKAPDMDKLPSEYLRFDLPKDEGMEDEGPEANPALPKEFVTLSIAWNSDAETGSFIVSVDARGRKPVEESMITAQELKAKEAGKRASVRDAAKRAVGTYIDKIGGKVGNLIIQISPDSAGRQRAPWAMVDLAYRVLQAVNTDRVENEQNEIQILLPGQFRQKVEFPKDDPAPADPTEDPRIVEDDKKDESKKDDGKRPGDWDGEDPAKKPGAVKSPRFEERLNLEADRANHDRVLAALDWLKDHQNRDGYWSASTFTEDSTRSNARKTYNIEYVETGQPAGDKGWESTCDIGLTGLALLAFTGDGWDHKQGDYRGTIRQAVLYLRKVQDNDGCFGAKEDDHFVYNHAICTLALAEIYGLSADPVLKPILAKAVDFILKAQNPGLGWRYGVQPGINDSSVTCWMVTALHVSRLAGIEIDTAKSFSDATSWYEMVTVNVNGYPKCGYDSPGSNNARLRSAVDYEHNPTMDAMYINAMLGMGKADAEDKTVAAMARSCVSKDSLPKWEHFNIDFYYWYHASSALYLLGGESWATWQKAVSAVLCDHQRGFSDSDKKDNLITSESLDEHGSWDPVGAWGSAGGRVYSTTLAALCLETEWRSFKEE